MARNLFGAELFFDRSRPVHRPRKEEARRHGHRVWTAPESEKIEPFTIRPPEGYAPRGRAVMRVVQ